MPHHDVVLTIEILAGFLIVFDRRTHRLDRDTFTWRAGITVGAFSLDFGAQWPFPGTPTIQYGDREHNVTLTIDPGAAVTDYKYTVTAVPSLGGVPISLDPHIIVSDGGTVPDGELDILETDLTNVQTASAELFGAVLQALAAQSQQDAAAGDKRLFFPFGIQNISVNVTGVPLSVKITVSGETAPSEEG